MPDEPIQEVLTEEVPTYPVWADTTRKTLVQFATLSFSGGISGTFGAIYCDHVFANAETGNLVSLAYDLKNMAWLAAGARFVAVLLFLAAIVVTVVAPLRLFGGNMDRWQRLCLVIELACVGLQACLPHDYLMAVAPAMYLWPMFFACALQYNTFGRLYNVPVSTVFSVNNLRQMILHFTVYLQGRRRDKREGTLAFTYFANIFSFFLGAFAGLFLLDWFGHLAILGCGVILLGNLIWLCCGKR